MKQAKFDRNVMRDFEISDLRFGEIAYIVPWAVRIDRENNLFVPADWPAHKKKGGTAELQITRTEDGVLCKSEDLKHLVRNPAPVYFEAYLPIFETE